MVRPDNLWRALQSRQRQTATWLLGEKGFWGIPRLAEETTSAAGPAKSAKSLDAVSKLASIPLVNTTYSL